MDISVVIVGWNARHYLELCLNSLGNRLDLNDRNPPSACGRRNGSCVWRGGEWNKASLSSFAMTSFRRLGTATKPTVFGRTIVSWAPDQSVEQKYESKKTALATTSSKPPSIPELP